MWLTITQLIIIMLTLVLAWLTYRTNQILEEFRPAFNVLLSGADNISRVGLIGFCLFLAWLSGLPVEQLGFYIEEPITSVLWGVACGIAILVPLNLLTHWAINQFGVGIYSSWLMQNIIPTSPREWVLVPLAFIPAVLMEELLFRSLLLGAFWDAFPPWLLIGATSVLFGFMHMPQGRLGVIAAGLLNVVLAILFISTWNILIPFAAHYTINVTQLITIRYQPWNYGDEKA